MYVIAIHEILEPQPAFERGTRLQVAADAPQGVSVLQFYPAADSSRVVCLWEGPSVQDIQRYVDTELGDATNNLCFEVAAEPAFAERPLGLATTPLSLRSA